MSAMANASLPPAFLTLLAHGVRWQLLSALARSDYRVQDLAGLVDKPMNLVSYHLRRLREAKLVRERHSDADSRDVYYSMDLDRMRQLYRDAGEALHPALGRSEAFAADKAGPGEQPRARVLFLCTENSARSQMAEGILRHLGRGSVDVYSTGTRPTEVHPLAVRAMAEIGVDISQHRSKSLDEFLGQSFDYIITVCDRIKEACPTFPGDPERIHWSFADPAAAEGTEQTRYWAFKLTSSELLTMIRFLLITIERDRREADKFRYGGVRS